MTARPALATPSDWRRHPGAIAVAVVALHAVGLWALQSGLLRRAVETVVPAEILVEILDGSPEPSPTPPAPPAAAPAAKPAPVSAQAAPPPAAALPSALATPVPVPTPAPSPSPPATTPSANAIASGAADATPVRAASQNGTENKAPKALAAAPVAAPRIELPNSDVAELNNPKGKYPTLSWRLGEEGVAVVSILVGIDGSAKEVRLAKSSGFERLDQAALADAQKLRFLPGKVDGVPQTMWRDKPFVYSLTKP